MPAPAATENAMPQTEAPAPTLTSVSTAPEPVASAPACGDGVCSVEEACDTCSEDCGVCPPVVPVGWTCDDQLFGEGDCHCGCGVSDSDCMDGSSDVCSPGVTGCPDGQEPINGENWQCRPIGEETDAEIAARITSVPAGFPDVPGRPGVNDHYAVQRYLHLPKFDLHLFGTEDVIDWTFVGSYRMLEAMVDSLLLPEDQEQFRGHHLFIITGVDPDVPGAALPGHKNTGTIGFTVILQDIICLVGTDPIRPNETPRFYDWWTPIHEFGHAIEHTLRLESRSDEIFSANVGNYNADVRREYFPWLSQTWWLFDPNEGPAHREDLADFRRDYFSSLFDIDHPWGATCEGRPMPEGGEQAMFLAPVSPQSRGMDLAAHRCAASH